MTESEGCHFVQENVQNINTCHLHLPEILAKWKEPLVNILLVPKHNTDIQVDVGLFSEDTHDMKTTLVTVTALSC